METLGEYARRIEKALENKTPYSSYNKDMLHATIIVSAMFRHTEREVLLLSNCLDWQLYESMPLLEAVDEFLDKEGTSLTILVESDVSPDHFLLDLVRDRPNVTMHQVPKDVVNRYPFNFMLVDNFGYRFESDRREPKAVVSLHEDTQQATDVKTALRETFGHLLNQSEEIAH